MQYIKLVKTDAPVGDRFAPHHRAPPSALPRVLVVTSHRDRYGDLPADIDFAPDRIEAVANAISVAYSHIFTDMWIGERESGCELVRSLRTEYRVRSPIYLVSDAPLPSDREYALAQGATGLVLRDRRALAALVRGDDGHEVERRSFPLPRWTGDVVAALRQFIASEAESRVRSIVFGLQQRMEVPAIEAALVINEASLLLDNLDDRRAFLRLAKAQIRVQ